MWFYTKTFHNLEPLQNLVCQKDVIRIASIINAQQNEWICSRIGYELALDGDSGYDTQTEPLLIRGIEAISESFFLSNDYQVIKKKLEKISRALKKTKEALSDCEIIDVINGTLDKKQNLNTNDLVDQIECYQKAINTLLFDSRNNKKQKNKDWGNLGYYKVYISDVIHLFTSLTGKKFTVDFALGDNNKGWKATTDAGLFVYEFHLILNKVAKAYSCNPFTDSNFKNTCSEIRKKLNCLDNK